MEEVPPHSYPKGMACVGRPITSITIDIIPLVWLMVICYQKSNQLILILLVLADGDLVLEITAAEQAHNTDG
jgi:hypothetical protein